MTATERLDAIDARAAASSVSTETIDKELRLLGYFATDEYPEHSHGDLRAAWRDGYETGTLPIPDLTAAIRDVLKLHTPGWHIDTSHYCQGCGSPLTEDTPNCPTVGAITNRLGDA